MMQTMSARSAAVSRNRSHALSEWVVRQKSLSSRVRYEDVTLGVASSLRLLLRELDLDASGLLEGSFRGATVERRNSFWKSNAHAVG